MNPSTVILMGHRWCYPQDLGLEPVGLNEIFVELVFYDLTILPYHISNYGRVYSHRYKRLLKPYCDSRNYYRVTIAQLNGKHVFTGVHKLELMSFQPILEAKDNIYIPNHKDGNPSNNYLGNLEWMTVSENTRHALDTGLANYKCENNSRSYLSNQQVHMICSMLEKHKSPSEIADALEVYIGNPKRNSVCAIIRLIRAGQTYLDISTQYDIPGIHGKRFYEPEMTKAVCEYLTDGNVHYIDEVCDHFNIPMDDRKMFKNYLIDVSKGNTHTYISRQYPKISLPKNVSIDLDPYYEYYN